jgi:hypothetical protein
MSWQLRTGHSIPGLAVVPHIQRGSANLDARGAMGKDRRRGDPQNQTLGAAIPQTGLWPHHNFSLDLLIYTNQAVLWISY